jgi:hypothetical protein
MSKDKRHINIHKTVHRELLKAEGRVHLPPNKVQTPKTAYKRRKFKKSDLRTIHTD